MYRVVGHGFHKTATQQAWGLKTEIHHKPGDGLTDDMFHDVLAPLGFEVEVYRHNHQLGAEVLQGRHGQAEFKYRIGSLLSGRHPDAPHSALSLMCVARKHGAPAEAAVAAVAAAG